jgi:hypothetical protein
MLKLPSDFFIWQLASLVTHTFPPNDRQHTAAPVAVFPTGESKTFSSVYFCYRTYYVLLLYLNKVMKVFSIDSKTRSTSNKHVYFTWKVHDLGEQTGSE